MFDGEAFGAEIVAHVKSHVSNSIAPLLSEIMLLKARIAELETREPLRGEKGEPGLPGAPGPPGPAGESITGPKGDCGSTILCGKGEPEQNGRSGDIYLDVETGNLYQFKS